MNPFHFKAETIGKRNRSGANSKQHNKHKLRVIENAKKILNNITVCNVFVPEDELNGWGNSAVYAGSKPIKVSPALAWNLDNIRTRWEITCGVFCRDQLGQHYMQYYTIQADQDCLSMDVAEQAQKVCYWLYNNAPKLNKLCPFWLAMPRCTDKTPDLALAIKTAHKHKVFDRISTNFEINVNAPEVNYHDAEWFNIPFNWDKVELAEVNLEEALSYQPTITRTEEGQYVYGQQ